MRAISVINPNSSVAVTEAIDDALMPLRTEGNPPIVCITLADGPPAIESQVDVDDAATRVCNRISSFGAKAGAFVIACFSDPGLADARQKASVPVFGIGESAILTAMSLGNRIGVISILESSVERHMRQFSAMCVEGRIAGDVSIESGVAGLQDETDTLHRMMVAAKRLRDDRGANVLVLACAGMARYRKRLQDFSGVPVIDPTQAATGLAITALAAGYSR